MGFLTSILTGPILGSLVKLISGPLLELYKVHLDGKISMEQLQTEMVKMLTGAFAQVETQHSEDLTKTYATFMGSVEKAKALQYMLIAVVASQTFVMVWYQFFVPLITFFCACKYPSAGSTIDWTYALVAGLCGLGPVALRFGPGSSNTAAQLLKLKGK